MQIMKHQNKLKENQSLDQHLKPISMHLVQRERVVIMTLSLPHSPLLKTASTSLEVSKALWTFGAEAREQVGSESDEEWLVQPSRRICRHRAHSRQSASRRKDSMAH